MAGRDFPTRQRLTHSPTTRTVLLLHAQRGEGGAKRRMRGALRAAHRRTPHSRPALCRSGFSREPTHQHRPRPQTAISRFSQSRSTPRRKVGVPVSSSGFFLPPALSLAVVRRAESGCPCLRILVFASGAKLYDRFHKPLRPTPCESILSSIGRILSWRYPAHCGVLHRDHADLNRQADRIREAQRPRHIH